MELHPYIAGKGKHSQCVLESPKALEVTLKYANG